MKRPDNLFTPRMHAAVTLHTAKLVDKRITCCSSWNDNAYEFVLENQAGQGLKLEDPEDRKALVMGLALHQQGKQQLDKVRCTLMLDMCMPSYS